MPFFLRTAAQNLRTCTHRMYGRKNAGAGISRRNTMVEAAYPKVSIKKAIMVPACNVKIRLERVSYFWVFTAIIAMALVFIK